MSLYFPVFLRINFNSIVFTLAGLDAYATAAKDNFLLVESGDDFILNIGLPRLRAIDPDQEPQMSFCRASNKFTYGEPRCSEEGSF